MITLKKFTSVAICMLFMSLFSQTTYAEVRWEQKGENWYCYDDNNVPLSGWVDYKNESYYMNGDGLMLTSQITPDGHYVDRNGELITYEDCKEMFDALEKGLMNGNSNSDIYVNKVSQAIDLVKFKNNENKEMQDIIQKLHMFNKEVNMSNELAFYIKVTDNQNNYSIRVKGTDADLATWRKEQSIVNETIDKIAQEIKDLPDREKFNRIVSTLCDSLTYDYSLNNTSAYDGLTGQGTVCNGHMKLFALLARKSGLESKVVVGYANNELHGWNQIKLDGVWYHTDLTWYVSSGNAAYLLLSPEEVATRNIVQIYE